MGQLKDTARRLYGIMLRIGARRAVSRLRREAGAVSGSLADAIEKTLDDTADPAEKAWIDRIESLRERLSASGAEISVVIYGVPSPELELTEEQMYRGSVFKRTVGDICRSASKPYFWTLFLFRLVREFRPSVCLELGTCLGISAAYLASALTLNGRGTVVSLEGADTLASRAEDHFRELGLDNVRVVTGRFQDTLDGVLAGCGPIDFAFVDGHHDEKATIAYYRQICPFLAPGAVLVFDDISWSRGMERAWRTIEADERVTVAVNLKEVGVCVVDGAVGEKLRYRMRLI